LLCFYNGLYLDPHLLPELNGTQLKYWLRGKLFTIDLSVNDYVVTVNGKTVRDTVPFAVDDKGDKMSLKDLPMSTNVVKKHKEDLTPESPFESLYLTSKLEDFSFTARKSNEPINATLFDLQGRKVATLLNGKFTGHHQISHVLPGLSSGIYILEVSVNTVNVLNKKFLIES